MTPQIQLLYQCRGYIFIYFVSWCHWPFNLCHWLSLLWLDTQLPPNCNSALHEDPFTEEQKPMSGQHKHPTQLARECSGEEHGYWVWDFPAVWPWANIFKALQLNFLICKMGIIIVLYLKGSLQGLNDIMPRTVTPNSKCSINHRCYYYRSHWVLKTVAPWLYISLSWGW